MPSVRYVACNAQPFPTQEPSRVGCQVKLDGSVLANAKKPIPGARPSLHGERRRRHRIDNELKREQERFHAAVKVAKRGFGQWDPCDEVVWALLRVCTAQTAFARAIEKVECYDEDARLVEVAIAERVEAIADLQKAIREQPRGYQ
jgi:hypothetical protein